MTAGGNQLILRQNNDHVVQAGADPSLAAERPYKAVVERDRVWLAAMLDHVPELLRDP